MGNERPEELTLWLVHVYKGHIVRTTHVYARDEMHARALAAPWVALHFDYPVVEFQSYPRGFSISSIDLPGKRQVEGGNR